MLLLKQGCVSTILRLADTIRKKICLCYLWLWLQFLHKIFRFYLLDMVVSISIVLLFTKSISIWYLVLLYNHQNWVLAMTGFYQKRYFIRKRNHHLFQLLYVCVRVHNITKLYKIKWAFNFCGKKNNNIESLDENDSHMNSKTI